MAGVAVVGAAAAYGLFCALRPPAGEIAVAMPERSNAASTPTEIGNGLRTSSFFTPSVETLRKFSLKVMGGDAQVAQLCLSPGQSLLVEPGALLYRSPGVELRTTLGEGGLMSALGRVFSGEPFFVNVVSVPVSKVVTDDSPKDVVGISAAGASRLVVLDLNALGGEVLANGSAFLFSTSDVGITPAPPPNLFALAAGSGLILQRLSGTGIACVQGKGTVIQQTLKRGETITVDPSALLSITPSVQYDLAFSGGPNEVLFGGGGAWVARLHGPGAVLMQSLGEGRRQRLALS